MPDDRESEADSKHRDTEEERRQRRTNQQDQEQETQPPSRDPSGGKHSKSGEEGDTGRRKPDYSPGDLLVPNVPLEDVAEADSVNPIVTIPAIEQARRDVTVPELSLHSIDVETTSVNVATDVPDIAAEEKEWQIPLVQLGSAPTVQFQPSSFNTGLQEPPKRRRQPLSVPLFRRVSTPRVRFVPALGEDVDDEIRRRLERLETDDSATAAVQKTEIQDEEEEKVGTSDVAVGSTASTGSGGHAGGTGEEVPIFEDVIFNGAGGAATTSEGTTIVLFNEAEDNSYVGSYLTLCRRIYREVNGGYPEFQPINDLDEINKREIERWLDADKRVIYIDLDDRDRQIDEAKLREKLEATIGEFGFIVFKATDSDLVAEYRDILNEINIESPHPPLNVVEVAPRQPGFNVERQMTELCWGNLNLPAAGPIHDKPEIERPTGKGVFDDLFNRYAPMKFDDYFDGIKSDEGGLFKRFTTENQGQIQGKERDDASNGESSLHYDIKVYIVWYLVKRLRGHGEDIDGLEDIGQWMETESKLGEGVIPDVFFDGQRQEVYEVETLFSGGQEPTKKIDQSINKYKEHDVTVDKIHIILENFTFLRHLNELSNIKQHYAHRTNEDGESLIEFETLDLQNSGLLSLTTVIDEVKDFEE